MKEFKIKMKNQTVHELKTIDKQQDLCGCEKRADLIALLLEELKKRDAYSTSTKISQI